MFTKIRMREEKGFTLIELLIVVAIIGILAAIAIPQFSQYRKRGYKAATASDVKNAYTSAQAYLGDNMGATSITVANLVTLGLTRATAGVTLGGEVSLTAGSITASHNAVSGSSTKYSASTGLVETGW